MEPLLRSPCGGNGDEGEEAACGHLVPASPAAVAAAGARTHFVVRGSGLTLGRSRTASGDKDIYLPLPAGA